LAEDLKCCSICGGSFSVRFAYQVDRSAEGTLYYCSQRCQESSILRRSVRTCAVCGSDFHLLYAYQQAVLQGERLSFCSTDCRSRALERARARAAAGASTSTGQRAHRIAVLNQKGGTGKTTSAVSLAAGLAEVGYRTLLIDMDSQGNVGVSLGLRGEGRSLYHVLVGSCSAAEAAVNARPNLDVILGNESLATAEMRLAQMARSREQVLTHRMRSVKTYDYVILDCGPSISLLNQNALTYADQVLIPVSCDYLSLVGVKQILKTLKMVNDVLRHPITILGVLPTFYDRRNRISNEAVATLKAYFEDRVLPPIRVNTRLKEAPSHSQSIFEYAPGSRGSQDYRRLVKWLVARNTGVGMAAVEETRPDRGVGADHTIHGDGPVMQPVGRSHGVRPQQPVAVAAAL